MDRIFQNSQACIWLLAAGPVVGLGAGVGVAVWGLSARHSAAISQLKQSHAEQSARASADALARLLDAQQLGDRLTARLQHQEQANTQLQKDKAHALRQLTTGRTCLSADAVRVLNHTGTGLADLPATAAGAAATGEPVATDTDIAGWISGAQFQHEQCRQRLDALIDFFPPDSKQ
ncbi:MAG: hypothetical protein KAY21_05555 [Limnohabitans sp.]|nr:hypothetical protein [Limnohabitans sp.]